jgi:hypothetical protein
LAGGSFEFLLCGFKGKVAESLELLLVADYGVDEVGIVLEVLAWASNGKDGVTFVLVLDNCVETF